MTTKTYPYTYDQLRFFRNEIKKAGGIDELMILKEALKKDGKTTLILAQENIERYKKNSSQTNQTKSASYDYCPEQR